MRKKHSLVEIPIDDSGRMLPLLIFGDGEDAKISGLVTAYVRNLQILGSGPRVLLKTARAIGFFHDYCEDLLINSKDSKIDPKVYLAQFYQARRFGFVRLGWEPVEVKVAQDEVRWISEFSYFCHQNFGHLPVNREESLAVSALTNIEFRGWIERKRKSKEYSLLSHLDKPLSDENAVVRRWSFAPESGRATRSKTAKYFPPRRVLDFVINASNIRDRLLWMLMFFGGIRISEALHLLVRDIIFEKKTGCAVVILADPVDGAIDWVNRKNGRKENGTRAKFLASQYDLIPRNQLGATDPLSAGWKGMMLDDSRKRQSRVIWLNEAAGRAFWELHKMYMNMHRLHIGDLHPYYFVSLNQQNYGEPYKYSNAYKRFSQNAKNIGIASHDDGVNPHGARHFYGFFLANVLKLSIETTQKAMHHRSPISTEVYYHIGSERVRKEISKAYENVEIDISQILSRKELEKVVSSYDK